MANKLTVASQWEAAHSPIAKNKGSLWTPSVDPDCGSNRVNEDEEIVGQMEELHNNRSLKLSDQEHLSRKVLNAELISSFGYCNLSTILTVWFLRLLYDPYDSRMILFFSFSNLGVCQRLSVRSDQIPYAFFGFAHNALLCNCSFDFW